MRRDPLKGQLFENMVIVEALKAQLNRGKDSRLYFFRDSHGNEVDLLIPHGRQLAPYEIKSGQTWHRSFLKGLTYFERVVGERSLKGTVVYGGDQALNTDSFQLIPFRDIAGLGAVGNEH